MRAAVIRFASSIDAPAPRSWAKRVTQRTPKSPMPMSMTANAELRMLRWPTVSVSQASDQDRPTSMAETVIRGVRKVR
jgi:hypothetical protein